jgi:hypothetical protein
VSIPPNVRPPPTAACPESFVNLYSHTMLGKRQTPAYAYPLTELRGATASYRFRPLIARTTAYSDRIQIVEEWPTKRPEFGVYSVTA